MTSEIPEWLDEVEKRCGAATPGEWDVHQFRDLRPWEVMGTNQAETMFRRKVAEFPIYGYSAENNWMIDENKANAEFIARSKQDIPLLLAYCRRLRDALEGVCLCGLSKTLMPNSKYKCKACHALELTLEDLKHDQ